MGKGFWGGNVGTWGWSTAAPSLGNALRFMIMNFIILENFLNNLKDFLSILILNWLF